MLGTLFWAEGFIRKKCVLEKRRISTPAPSNPLIRDLPATAKRYFNSSSTRKPRPKKSMILSAPQAMVNPEETMDQFYGNWWSDQNTKTVCIPGSQDTLNANNAQLSKNNNSYCLYEERNAEEVVHRTFQKLNLGGLFVTGYRTAEYTAKSKLKKLLKTFDIEDVDIDAIFVHPLMGIVVMEIKEDKKDKGMPSILNSTAYERAIERLERYRQKLPEVFNWLCKTEECNIPIYLAICFPFETFTGGKRNSFIHIDKSLLGNIEEMREMFACRMNFRPENAVDVLDLKKIAIAMAAYRTVEFASLGINALAFHEMTDPFNSSDSASNIFSCDIYWRNDQLSVLECSNRRQVIFGPAGTGKTTILIQKAIRAAQSEKVDGTVYVLVDSPELRCKLNNYFDSLKETFLRPCIVGDTSLLYFENGEPEDDIFIDELPCWLGLLSKFLKLRGNVAMVVNELNKFIQCENIQSFMKAQESLHVRFTALNFVIQC